GTKRGTVLDGAALTAGAGPSATGARLLDRCEACCTGARAGFASPFPASSPAALSRAAAAPTAAASGDSLRAAAVSPPGALAGAGTTGAACSAVAAGAAVCAAGVAIGRAGLVTSRDSNHNQVP